MTKKRKITAIVISAAAFIVVLLVGAANYLVDFGLYRVKPDAKIENKKPNLAAAVITGDKNKKELNRIAASWRASVQEQELSIVSGDGLKLYASEFVQPVKTNRWVICIHGYHTIGRTSVMPYAMFWYKEGCNVLVPDNRTHGKSEGKYVGMGYLDRLDIVQWINKIVSDHKDAQIILHGESMGAATVMMVTGETLPPNVICAVEDCGYSSVWDEFKVQIQDMKHLPPYPLLPIASLMSKIRAGYFFGEASAVNAVARSKTPTLFIHGSADTFVPARMVFDVYGAASCPKKLFIVPDAEHARSMFLQTDLYWKTVFAFADTYWK